MLEPKLTFMKWTDNITEWTGIVDAVKKTQDRDQWRKFVVVHNRL